MDEGSGPGRLRDLVNGLGGRLSSQERDLLAEFADVWQAEHSALDERLNVERTANAKLSEQLAAAQKQVEILEQDRKWWLENAIKRRKRAEARGSTRSPRGREKT